MSFTMFNESLATSYLFRYTYSERTGTEKKKSGGEAAELIPFASWVQSSISWRKDLG